MEKFEASTNFQRDTVPLADTTERTTSAFIEASGRITIAGTTIDIRTETGAFEALLQHRHQPYTHAELHEFSQATEPLPDFTRQLGRLAAKLFEVKNQPLVIVDGMAPEATYQLFPGLELIDQRNQASADVVTILRQRIRAEHTLQNEADSQLSPRQRLYILSQLVQEYAEHRQARRAILQLYREHHTAQTRSDWITPDPKDCQQYAEAIESALQAIAFSDASPEALESEIINAVIAQQSLYFQHFYLIDSLARRYGHQLNPRDRLVQQGSIALLRFIGEYTAQQGEFTSGAFYEVSNAMLPASVRMHKLKERISVAREVYIQRCGEEPKSYELADMLGIPAQEVEKADKQLSTKRDAALLEKTIDQELELLELRSRVEEVMASDALNDREKVVLSLHFGSYAPALAGATFNAHSTYEYPFSEADMPNGYRSVSILKIAELTGASVGAVYAVMNSALEKARALLQQAGIDALDD
ncbi:MAG TPA: hypothetical protein VD907_03645 [Verrucomicrobiae bacterium]|nr:hypothetical protein [Verrucomicrobiae bacterium]